MKNKLLGYLCSGLLVITMCFMFGHVYADCGCEYYGYDQDAYNKCMKNCVNQQQQGGGGCGGAPYCCDGDPSSIPCEDIPEITAERCPGGCCGIKLNTNFPIIGNCIETGKGGTDSTQAFPKMIGALTKIVMALILVACFITIIVAGIMLASAGEDQQQTKTARDWIKRVAITILLLGFSGAILRLINPNFFG